MPIGKNQPGKLLHGRVQRPSPRRFRAGGMGKRKMGILLFIPLSTPLANNIESVCKVFEGDLALLDL